MKLSQEKLKLIACVSMLLDHIGAVFFPGSWLRIVGRLAFPIYAFLLAEGVHYTRNPKKYALRLLLVLVLSEIPYDLLFYGGIRVLRQNVMVTLLLAFCMGIALQQVRGWKRYLIVLLFVFLGEVCHGDYGGWGVLLAAVFLLTRGAPRRMLWAALVLVLMGWNGGGFSIQAYAVLALIPLSMYSGKKETHSKWVQWGFSLFYPAHLMALLLLK